MAKHSDSDDGWEARRNRIIGLGERSFRKSYYPQLRQNLDRLERFRTLLDRTSDFVVLLALPEGTIIDANMALAQLLGRPLDTLIGHPLASLGVADATAILDDLRREMSGPVDDGEVSSHSQIAEYRLEARSIWLELSYRVAVVDQRSYGVLMGRDITERKRSHELVTKLLAEKEALLDNALVGIAMLRRRRIVACNRRFEEIFGYPPGTMAGQSTRRLYASDDVFSSFGNQVYDALNDNRSFSATLMFARADGSTFWGEATGRVIDPAHPQDDSIWVISDVTERREAEEKARFLAFHDALTGLPNPLLIQDRLDQAKGFADRAAMKIALMVVDLDRFKTINDSLGRGVGNRLLIEVARRLRNCVQDTDTVCRQGGDEFLILLPNLADADACAIFLAKVMDNLLIPFKIDDRELVITVSIGIAVYPDDGADFESLLKKADMAMYRAKGAGRNAYHFFNAEMNGDAEEQLTLHFGLRRALDSGQFVLHFQPQIEIASGTLIGAEALIRWHHPEHGLILPGRFIPVAEENGMIVPLGEWVLRAACCQARRWQDETGLPGLVVAVNLSALQFKRGDIERSVTLALQESGLDPSQLELELTESILIQETEKVLATVMRLKHMGVKLSIDDFGTGYSSLSYLKRFKVDKLKIDQSFIRDLATDSESAAIVRAIIQMARSLGLRTIAEGVEDKPALELLRLYHCDEAQGYYFSRPVPADEFSGKYRTPIPVCAS